MSAATDTAPPIGDNRLTVLAGLAEQIRTAKGRMDRSAEEVAEASLACGHRLCEAKALLQHGEWSAWLADNCTISERHAQRLMKLAKSGADIRHVADLGLEGAIKHMARAKALPAGTNVTNLAAEREAREIAREQAHAEKRDGLMGLVSGTATTVADDLASALADGHQAVPDGTADLPTSDRVADYAPSVVSPVATAGLSIPATIGARIAADPTSFGVSDTIGTEAEIDRYVASAITDAWNAVAFGHGSECIDNPLYAHLVRVFGGDDYLRGVLQWDAAEQAHTGGKSKNKPPKRSDCVIRYWN